MLTRRLQVLLDEERYRRLRAQARERRLSIGALIREAIDRAFPPDVERRRAAARRILAAPRIHLPDPEELKKELEELRYGKFARE